jgi:hypothetical protein
MYIAKKVVISSCKCDCRRSRVQLLEVPTSIKSDGGDWERADANCLFITARVGGVGPERHFLNV